MRLVARHPPRLRGRRKNRNEGDPLAQSRKQGPILFCVSRRDHSCRVGKGEGTTLNTNERLSCAVPTKRHQRKLHHHWRARLTLAPTTPTDEDQHIDTH